ncbi:MAG: hypothetical protein AAF581_13160 [Planctomycetota bacterium]
MEVRYLTADQAQHAEFIIVFGLSIVDVQKAMCLRAVGCQPTPQIQNSGIAVVCRRHKSEYRACIAEVAMQFKPGVPMRESAKFGVDPAKIHLGAKIHPAACFEHGTPNGSSFCSAPVALA